MRKLKMVRCDLQLDPDMAERLRAHHSDVCRAILDCLELQLYTAKERAQRDRQRIAYAT